MECEVHAYMDKPEGAEEEEEFEAVEIPTNITVHSGLVYYSLQFPFHE